MRACTRRPRAERRQPAAVAAALLALALALGACAGGEAPRFRVERVTARLVEDGVLLSAGVDLSLSEEAVTALGNGVPLVLLTDVRLFESRPFMWDRSVARWRLRAELRYHALSGRYVLSRSDRAEPETFLTAQEAVAGAGGMRRVRLPLAASRAQLDESGELELGMRVRLDIESLPAPLRPLAYLSPAWRMNSSWTRWPAQS